jgi:hypothetical protein
LEIPVINPWGSKFEPEVMSKLEVMKLEKAGG